MKKCIKCGIEKPYSEYYKEKTCADGYKTSCKTCMKESVRQWRLNNTERHNFTTKRWRKNHPEKVDYYHQTYRDWETDRKSTRLNSSHLKLSRMPSSA